MALATAALFFRSQDAEVLEGVVRVEGELPRGLRGTLLRAGPGLQQVGDDALAFFDGHGLVGAVGFADGRVSFRAAHVRTPAYEAERRAGRALERRGFTNLPRRWENLLRLRLANVANHDVFAWGGRLHATAVGATACFALHPVSLATVGPLSPAGPGQILAPMPRVDPRRHRLVTYAVKPGGLRPDTIRFLELDERWRCVHAAVGPLSRAGAQLHDVAFTDRWLLGVESPQRPDVPALLWGRRPVFEALRFPEGGRPRLVLGAREGGAGVCAIDLPEGICHVFHLVNAWDDGEGLFVDVLATARPPRFAASYPPGLRRRHGLPDEPYPETHLLRLRVDPAGGRAEAERLLPYNVELPAVEGAQAGRRHGRAWFASVTTGAPQGVEDSLLADSLVAFEEGAPARSWRAEPPAIVSQPAFAPGGTDGGWLLAFTLDRQTSEASVVVLEARAIDRGPVARVVLAPFLPPASHCRFEPALSPA